jgi:hypothetical protein
MGADREAASKIEGFDDLWKTLPEPQAVGSVYRFRDCFESLVLAQSMLEALQSDQRLRSRFLCGGKGGERVRYFKQWLSCVQAPSFSVALINALTQLLVWLANEKTEPPSADDLAKAWFNVRAPSAQQLRIAEAIWHGFLLGHSSWALWNYIGNRTRAKIEIALLETWRKDLAKRFAAVSVWHDELRAAFYKPVSDAQGGHFQFNERAHRMFVDSNMRRLLNRVSALVAMAIEDALPQSVVARFEDFVLCEATSNVRHKATLDARIHQKLQQAFPRSNFKFRIEGAA